MSLILQRIASESLCINESTTVSTFRPSWSTMVWKNSSKTKVSTAWIESLGFFSCNWWHSIECYWLFCKEKKTRKKCLEPFSLRMYGYCTFIFLFGFLFLKFWTLALRRAGWIHWAFSSPCTCGVCVCACVCICVNIYVYMWPAHTFKGPLDQACALGLLASDRLGDAKCRPLSYKV